ncbi:MAG: 3-isopropylmalate dehydratase small subunit [Chloroflexi bacterium]|jgi:3-isopropylmalate/(R)-2-methylmalate dehydratase small subunit|nr:3-isopropylmalate dehydratase small subunit [Chloroflexota bacterium]MBP05938.1 3-isopropylmalate dehydratase small subunit [Chloroflexota bacterium]RZP13579.1 MAG: 3-isopropylmalate dehydratase small subunit [Chloroflexota bacterium]|tara:strand:- start:2362 stop:2946 length:585 start_codon:yes stop_codon:yes gene_type:complete
MEKFIEHTGLVAPLDRVNVDTDQIIPKQFLKRIERTGFGEFAFYDWRYLEDGVPNPDFILNNPKFSGASILVAGPNFGSGSSREHAPWALSEYGFKVIISSSFADIFRNNCMQNGIVTVVLPTEEIDVIMTNALRVPGYKMTVNLENQILKDKLGFSSKFDFDPFRKDSILKGLDDIGITLQNEEDISIYESKK